MSIEPWILRWWCLMGFICNINFEENKSSIITGNGHYWVLVLPSRKLKGSLMFRYMSFHRRWRRKKKGKNGKWMQKSHLKFFKITLGSLLWVEKIKKEVRKEGRTLVERRSCPQSWSGSSWQLHHLTKRYLNCKCIRLTLLC